ncbi:MAG: hypothetical protein WDW38_000179 [Sanguina aurantia]
MPGPSLFTSRGYSSGLDVSSTGVVEQEAVSAEAVSGGGARSVTADEALALSVDDGSDNSSTSSSADSTGDGPTTALQISAARSLAIVFTCGKCETRSTKSFSRQAYEKGVVIITCPGCEARHLIADNLGWLGEKGWRVEALEGAVRRSVGGLAGDQDSARNTDGSSSEPTMEELAGWSRVQALRQSMQAAADDGSGSSSGSGEQLEVLPEDVAAWNKVEGHGK